MTRSVAIVGGGFSGALLAINLWRHGGPAAVLIERRGAPGKGVAYSASQPTHVLNVRAANMSAFPDDPDHFVRWLAERSGGAPNSFVSRQVYGAYLSELLDDAAGRAGDRLRILSDDVVDMAFENKRAVLRLASGNVLHSDIAVLAVGNLPPHLPSELTNAALAPPLYIAEPWNSNIAEGLAGDDTVLLIGTGLTTVDCALTLDQAGFSGSIVALSRHGLVPRAHGSTGPLSPPPLEQVPERLSEVLAAMRKRSREAGWRTAVDELRPVTQALWARAPIEARRRFLRHGRAWWDVHRHRLAPEIAARIRGMQERGVLRFGAGRLLALETDQSHVGVTWRIRGTDRNERLHVRRVINCTGPAGDLRAAADPLLARLHTTGEIRADACRLGVDIDAQARVRQANGEAHPCLHAVGPMTRGAFWEVTAVPDIRRQVWDLARRLSNAHWVGGEGL